MTSNNYVIQYIEGVDEYVISFSVKENSFVFETELRKGNKYLDNNVKEKIAQNIIPPYNKLNIFIEALGKIEEINNMEKKLYEDIISLYEQKKI